MRHKARGFHILTIYLQEFFENILRGIIMAFAVRRDAPFVAPARFEYTLEDGRREGWEEKKPLSARAKTVIVQSSGDGGGVQGVPTATQLKLIIFLEKKRKDMEQLRRKNKANNHRFITIIVFNNNLSAAVLFNTRMEEFVFYLYFGKKIVAPDPDPRRKRRKKNDECQAEGSGWGGGGVWGEG
jgi:hypothetical protein